MIPKDFSRTMLTFFSAETTSAQLTYFTNEKKCLAPKITGQGAQQLSHQVNEVFAQTNAQVGVNLLGTLTRTLADEGNQ